MGAGLRILEGSTAKLSLLRARSVHDRGFRVWGSKIVIEALTTRLRSVGFYIINRSAKPQKLMLLLLHLCWARLSVSQVKPNS